MKAEKPEPFVAPVPEGIEYLWIDKETGYLSNERCQGAIQVPFVKGIKPEYRVDCGIEPVQNSNKPLDWFRGWFRQE
jgi:penicillin-binding protein 1B